MIEICAYYDGDSDAPERLSIEGRCGCQPRRVCCNPYDDLCEDYVIEICHRGIAQWERFKKDCNLMEI